MKKLLIFSVIYCFAFTTVHAQKIFNVSTGKQILALLPATVKNKPIKKANDGVKPGKGFIGVTVHRDYGDNIQGIRVEVINRSPSLININNFLASPTITDPAKYLITVIDGYKALVQTLYTESGKVNYELLVPMTATLLTVKATGYSRDDLLAIAGTIPVAKIAKMVEK